MRPIGTLSASLDNAETLVPADRCRSVTDSVLRADFRLITGSVALCLKLSIFNLAFTSRQLYVIFLSFPVRAHARAQMACTEFQLALSGHPEIC